MDQHPHSYEPESRDVHTPLEAAAMSIAISLKRIADHLNERVGPKDPTYNGLSLDELTRATKAIMREMTHDR